MKPGNRSKQKSNRPVRPNVEELKLKKRLRKLFETNKISTTAPNSSVHCKRKPVEPSKMSFQIRTKKYLKNDIKLANGHARMTPEERQAETERKQEELRREVKRMMSGIQVREDDSDDYNEMALDRYHSTDDDDTDDEETDNDDSDDDNDDETDDDSGDDDDETYDEDDDTDDDDEDCSMESTDTADSAYEDKNSGLNESDDDFTYEFFLEDVTRNDEDDFNDKDYKLPDHVQTDLIIHQGTASKRALKPEDNVQFNSEDDEAQIVELHGTRETQCVAQPNAYERDELIKLHVEARAQHHGERNDTNESNDDNGECPRLWSRDEVKRFRNDNQDNENDNDEEEEEDEEGDNSDSQWDTEDEEILEQCSDDESIMSVGIQERYMQRSSDEDDDDDDDDESDDDNEDGIQDNYVGNPHPTEAVVIDFMVKLKAEVQTQMDEAKKQQALGITKRLPKIFRNTDCAGCIAYNLLTSWDTIRKKQSKRIENLKRSRLEFDLCLLELEERMNEAPIEAEVIVPTYDGEGAGENVSNDKDEEEDEGDDSRVNENEEQEEDNIEEPLNEEEEESHMNQEEEKEASHINEMEDEGEEEENLTSLLNETGKSMDESFYDAPMFDDNQEWPAETVEADSSSALITQSNFESSSFTLRAAVTDNIFCNAVNGNFVLVLLKGRFYLYGTVRLQLLAGRIEVYGHIPRVGNQLEVFSPRGCSVVDVRPLRQNEDVTDNAKDLSSQLLAMRDFFVHRDLDRILSVYEPATDAVLLLERNTIRQRCVNSFKRFMNENVFPNMNSIPRDRVLYASESLLQCFINTETSRQVLRCADEWRSLPFGKDTRMMLVGGKSVGKSTLLRWLVNRHLSQTVAGAGSRVLVIDLDIGQTELFVPDTVSCFVLDEPLLGPGFFLNRQPAKAFFVGDHDIVLAAHNYMRAVQRLLAYCHSVPEYRDMPWIVNTMGYNKGFGLELFSAVAGYVQPTDVVQLQSNKRINNFDMPLYAASVMAVPRCVYEDHEPREVNYVLHELRSAVLQQDRYKQEWDMGPKDLRYAMLLARLSDAVQGHVDWLSDCPPCYVPVDQIILWSPEHRDLSQGQLLQAINSNLVFMCRLLENDDIPECFGIGVFRGFDRITQQAFVVPAMPLDRLTDTNCLAFSKTTLPTAMYTNQGPKVKGVAPFVYNTVDANVSKSIKQMPYRPAAFLSGKQRKLP